jgi:hypothetical protein
MAPLHRTGHGRASRTGMDGRAVSAALTCRTATHAATGKTRARRVPTTGAASLRIAVATCATSADRAATTGLRIAVATCATSVVPRTADPATHAAMTAAVIRATCGPLRIVGPAMHAMIGALMIGAATIAVATCAAIGVRTGVPSIRPPISAVASGIARRRRARQGGALKARPVGAGA